jgi:drug/metabolite transporter (DMT)-like permease
MKGSGFFFALAAAITWGLVYTLDQKILAKVSPVSLLFVNSVLSLLMTAPFLLWKTDELASLFTTTRLHFSLVAGSLSLAVAANYFIYSAIRLLGAPTASTFEITYPFFVVIFSAALLRQEVRQPFMIGTLLIFIGVFLIMRWGS